MVRGALGSGPGQVERADHHSRTTSGPSRPVNRASTSSGCPTEKVAEYGAMEAEAEIRPYPADRTHNCAFTPHRAASAGNDAAICQWSPAYNDAARTFGAAGCSSRCTHRSATSLGLPLPTEPNRRRPGGGNRFRFVQVTKMWAEGDFMACGTTLGKPIRRNYDARRLPGARKLYVPVSLPSCSYGVKCLPLHGGISWRSDAELWCC